MASGDTETAILLALEALPKSGSGPTRPYFFDAEAALFNALLMHRQTAVFKHDAGVAQAAFDRSGKRIVTASYDKTARIWDVATGRQIAMLKGHHGAVERAGFSPDGRLVVTAARDGTARIWDAVSGAQRTVLGPIGDYPTAVFDSKGDRVLTAGGHTQATLWNPWTGDKILSLASIRDDTAGFGPDDRSFATSFERGVSVWNAEDGTLIHEFRVGTYACTLTFSPDGSRLLIGPWGTISYGSLPVLWDVSNGTEIARLSGHKSDTQLHGTAFSHDGRRIATVSLDGSARIWDGKSGVLVDVLGQEAPNVKLADIASDYRDQEMNSAFSPDDRLLATASMNGPLRIWDVGQASLFTTIAGHHDLVEHLEFNPVDSNELLTASHDGTARLWDVDGILTTALRQEPPPTFAAFSPDNVHLLTGGGDSKGHLWDLAGHEVGAFDTGEIVHGAAFSPDGDRVATKSLSGKISIWDVASKREIVRFASPGGLVQIQFGAKGDLLEASSTSGTARLWNAATGEEVATIKTAGRQIVFNRAGDLVLAATPDNAAHVLRTNGTELRALTGHDSRIVGAAFSPDGQLVATASLDRTARIWSAKDGNTVAILKGHRDALTTVAFSPDGQSLLTASRDGTARIWSALDGKQRVVLKGHSGTVDSAEFSSNGRHVLTASTQDGSARLWDAPTGREMAILANSEEKNRWRVPTRAAFNSDGTRVLIASYGEGIRLIRVFQTPQDLINFAKQTVPRELTGCERRRFFLPIEGEVGDCPG